MKTSRREFIKDVMLISLSANLGCKHILSMNKEQSAQLGEKLYVYNWSHYIAEDTIPNFEKEYGVKVIYNDTIHNNEEFWRILLEANVDCDLIFPSGFYVGIMINEGLLKKLDMVNISNFKNVEKRFTNLPFDPGNVYSVPYLFGITGMGLNTEKVSEQIDSWAFLWNERYKGRISMLDDMRGLANPALKLLGYGINTTDPKKIEQAKQLLLKQRHLVRFYDSSSDGYMDSLKSGEIWLCQGYCGDILHVMKENRSIKFVIPEEGTDVWIDNMCIPKKAKNKYTAEVFINYLLRPKVSAEITNFTHFATFNRAARKFIDPKILKNPAIYPSKDILDKCEFQSDVGAATEIYKRMFDEVTQGKIWPNVMRI